MFLKEKALTNQQPNKWNTELFEMDKKWLKDADSQPLKSLAFPVEKYDYYVFNMPFNFEIKNEKFLGIVLGENIGGKEDNFIYKPEVTLIFYARTQYTELNADVSSRNYPYLTMQGRVKIVNNFDFVGGKS
ncbi:hypothetical protein JSO62_02485 [Riemerella anatipestifer]|uniref:hypothetical protein n=1 Tax=Riemerella anatipestifer TaxID=34085 RepID=UPI0030BEAD14